jgi:hypothetical protein
MQGTARSEVRLPSAHVPVKMDNLKAWNSVSLTMGSENSSYLCSSIFCKQIFRTRPEDHSEATDESYMNTLSAACPTMW